ncbi:MAG: hypothetical protein H6981_07230 [Gammaproteobacteria bacterium]|nr:hypothetical protein [Gammaproteobacteria bacterium]
MNDQAPTLASQVEDYARLQFAREEIALILDLDPDQTEALVTGADADLDRAFRRGLLIANAEVRKAIYTQATNGSSPAQKQMMDLFERADRSRPSPKQPVDQVVEVIETAGDRLAQLVGRKK